MLKITLKARLSLNNYIHIWCPKGKYILKSFKFINDYYTINNFDSKITKYIARAPTTTTALPKLANLNTLRTPPFSLEKNPWWNRHKNVPCNSKVRFLQVTNSSGFDFSWFLLPRHLAFTNGLGFSWFASSVYSVHNCWFCIGDRVFRIGVSLFYINVCWFCFKMVCFVF